MTTDITADITPEMVRQLATRRVLGVSLRELEKEFGVSRFLINKALASDTGKAVMKGLTEDAVKACVLQAKQELTSMLPLVLTALRTNLEEGSMEAVREYFRVLGVSAPAPEKVTQQTQAIQIILPGHNQPKDIEVKNENSQ
jgi:hypothetical protein